MQETPESQDFLQAADTAIPSQLLLPNTWRIDAVDDTVTACALWEQLPSISSHVANIRHSAVKRWDQAINLLTDTQTSNQIEVMIAYIVSAVIFAQKAKDMKIRITKKDVGAFLIRNGFPPKQDRDLSQQVPATQRSSTWSKIQRIVMVFSGLEGAPAELVKTAKNEVQLAVMGNLGKLSGQICQSDAQILLEMHHTVRTILKRLAAPQEDTTAMTRAFSHLASDVMSQYSQITVESIYAAGFGMKMSPPTRMQIQNSKVSAILFGIWCSYI